MKVNTLQCFKNMWIVFVKTVKYMENSIVKFIVIEIDINVNKIVKH